MSKIVIACATLFLATIGAAFADNNSDVRVVSNRMQSAPVDVEQGTLPGPVVLAVPRFFELFVAICRSGEPGQEGTAPALGFRNTSDQDIEAFIPSVGTVIVQPAQEILQTHGLDVGGGGFLLNMQLGSGFTNGRRTVSTVTASGLNDNVGACSFQAQAIVHRL